MPRVEQVLDDIIADEFAYRREAIEEYALHPDLLKEYLRKGFDKVAVKTKKEWEAAGKPDGGWNGDAITLGGYTIADKEGRRTATLAALAGRYKFSDAHKSLVESGRFTQDQLYERNPGILGVSLMTIAVDDEGKAYFVTQIKGSKTRGAGALQGALVAGGMDAADFRTEKPLYSALAREAKEEVNIAFRGARPVYIVNEGDKVGNYNIGFVSQAVRLDDLLTQYARSAAEKLRADKNPEVAGLALLPLDGSLVRDGPDKVKKVRCYLPQANGQLEEVVMDKDLRPIGTAMLDYLLGDPENLQNFIQRATQKQGYGHA